MIEEGEGEEREKMQKGTIKIVSKKKKNVSKDVGQWEIPGTAGGKGKWYSHFTRRLAVSHTIKYIIVILHSNPTLAYSHREMKVQV